MYICMPIYIYVSVYIIYTHIDKHRLIDRDNYF